MDVINWLNSEQKFFWRTCRFYWIHIVYNSIPALLVLPTFVVIHAYLSYLNLSLTAVCAFLPIYSPIIPFNHHLKNPMWLYKKQHETLYMCAVILHLVNSRGYHRRGRGHRGLQPGTYIVPLTFHAMRSLKLVDNNTIAFITLSCDWVETYHVITIFFSRDESMRG